MDQVTSLDPHVVSCAAPPQPGLLYLRGLSTDKVFSLTVERVPHTENVVRPLTFALEMSVAEASEDLFMLRIAGVLFSHGFFHGFYVL